MYRVFCAMNTPPVTGEEQEKCLHSRFVCWRLAEKATSEQPASTRRAKGRKQS